MGELTMLPRAPQLLLSNVRSIQPEPAVQIALPDEQAGVTTVTRVVVEETSTVEVINVVTSACCVEKTVAAVRVVVTVTTLVLEAGLTAREHADVTMPTGYLVSTLGIARARFCATALLVV
jgi:hypothetical protein